MSSPKNNAPFSAFLRGFRYAASGIARCVREERNFRFHLIVALYVFLFTPCFSLTAAETGILILTVASVLMAELFNSAIERLCDRVSEEPHPLLGAAKDLAAGAVLVTAIASLLVAVLLFARWDVWVHIFATWKTAVWQPILLVLSFIPAAWFVFRK